MKTCSTCHVPKSEVEFNKKDSAKDGLSSQCKDCSRLSTEKSSKRSEALEKKRVREARYNKSPDVQGKRRAAVKRYYEKNPQAKLAHSYVNKALRNGKLVRGVCECCQSADVQAHHDDYSKPLEVRWFCKKHHDAWHLGTD